MSRTDPSGGQGHAELILIPGWAATPKIWDGIRRPLREADGDLDIRVVPWQAALPDTNGKLGGDLAGLARPTFLAGWSLGAFLALQAAAQHPAQVRGLILLSGTAKLIKADDYKGVDPKQARAMQLMMRKDPQGYLQNFFDAALAPRKDGDARAQLLAEAQAIPLDDLHKGLKFLMDTDLRDRLPEITMPTLLLHGTEDRIIPVASAEYLASRLPTGRLEKITGQGHALPVTSPQKMADAIAAFLKTCR